jgi:hypothetical protein
MTVDGTGWPARALAEFEAEFEVELSFKDGESLTVLDVSAPEGWLMARNAAGSEGLVPESYLTADGDEGMAEGDDFGDSANDALAQMPLGGFINMGRGRLLADFTAEADGELSVEAGGVVTLLRPAEGLPEGWLYGQRGGKEGLVPESYVERLMAGSDEPIPAELLAATDDFDFGDDHYGDAYDDGYGAALAATGSPGGLGASGGAMCMLSDFTAEDPKEYSCSRGTILYLVSDQRDGWAMVSTSAGGEPAGLVPSEFLSQPHGSMLADFNPEDEGEVSALAPLPRASASRLCLAPTSACPAPPWS